MASDMIAVAATRVEDRVFAALGLQNAIISFDSCESVEYGGVLLLLPFLLAICKGGYISGLSDKHPYGQIKQPGNTQK